MSAEAIAKADSDPDGWLKGIFMLRRVGQRARERLLTYTIKIAAVFWAQFGYKVPGAKALIGGRLNVIEKPAGSCAPGFSHGVEVCCRLLPRVDGSIS